MLELLRSFNKSAFPTEVPTKREAVIASPELVWPLPLFSGHFYEGAQRPHKNVLP
jgi:hypothetical protein